MIIEWLYRTTLDVTLLIGLVLVLRPIVLRTLGANIAYWLWLLPLVRAFLPDLPERNGTVLEAIGVPTENLSSNLVPIPDLTAMPATIPWQTLWLVGLCVWVAMRLVTWFRFRQALMERASVYDLSSQLKSALSEKTDWLSDNVQFYTCTSSSAPFVTGLFRPCIFLPQDFNQRFTSAEQVWVLVHELSHIKRKDLWVQALSELMRAIFWFNPVIHFGAQVMQADQELACDHSVLSECSKEDRFQYGKALIAGVGPHLVPSVMTFFTKNKERFIMLSKHKVSKLNAVLGLSLCAIIGIFALTKAPQSVAQRPQFDEVYDANTPVLLRGTITGLDQFEDYSFVYIDSVNQDGDVEPWMVEGGSASMMEKAGLTQVIIGRKAIIRGYQTMDKSCDPMCKINGRDIDFIDG